MNVESDIILVEGGADPACVLEQIELEISKIKEEAFSRKELLEKVEKWLAACEEESWLEEYNRVEYLNHPFVLNTCTLIESFQYFLC